MFPLRFCLWCIIYCGFVVKPAYCSGLFGTGEGFHFYIVDGEVEIDRAVSNVEGELVIPETIAGYPVTKIQSHAFSSEPMLTSVVLPNTLRVIGDNAFFSCPKLTYVDVGDGLQEIGARAFEYCVQLSSISLPAGVSQIGDKAFHYCIDLTAINVSPQNASYVSIDGVLFDQQLTRLLVYPAQRVGSLIIPQTVTKIEPSAFKFTAFLTEIDLPEGLLVVGESAFERSSVITVNIGGGVIEKNAFENCLSLESVTFGENVSAIGHRAFANCGSLTEAVIPGVLSALGNQAFMNCSSLESIELSQGAAVMDAEVFRQCPALTRVHIGGGAIGRDAFLESPNLSDVLLGPYMTIIGAQAFEGQSGLTDESMPDFVEVIEYFAFSQCDGLTKVDLVHAEIGTRAFYQCANLATVNVGSGTIGNWSFAECPKLTSIHFGSGITDINRTVFPQSWALEEIQVDPANVNYSSLDGVLFDHDRTTLLTYPTGKNDSHYAVPDGVEIIPQYAFNATELESLSIPSSVSVIHSFAFSGFTPKLAGIEVAAENPTFYSEAGFLYGSGGTYLMFAPKTLTGHYTVRDGVTYIADNTFQGCESLTSVTVPEGVTTLGRYSFRDCTSLVSIELPSSLYRIQEYAFSGCASLGPLTIPDGLGSIERYVFSNALNLTKLTFLGDAPHISSDTFANTELERVVYFDDSVGFTGSIWLQLRLWPLSRDPQSRITYSIEDYEVTITGYNSDAFDDLVIPAAIDHLPVVAIGNNAFEDKNLHSIEMPNTLVSIGEYALAGCDQISSLTLPDSLVSVGHYAFTGCQRITHLSFPDNVQSIGNHAWDDCDDLEQISFGAGLTQFTASQNAGAQKLAAYFVSEANQTFSSLDGVLFSKKQSILHAYPAARVGGVYHIPDGVEIINAYAFLDCSRLTEITLPDSVTIIYSGAFYNCSGLTDLILPDSLTSIHSLAFSGCSGIAHMTLPPNVSFMGTFALRRMDSLSTLTFEGNAPSMGSQLFDGVLYFHEGATGFTTPTWKGFPCEMIGADYKAWISLIYPDSQQWNAHNLPDKDANFDGLSNFQSYLLGGRPDSAGDWIRLTPTHSGSDPRLDVQFFMREEALNYRYILQIARNSLADWSDAVIYTPMGAGQGFTRESDGQSTHVELTDLGGGVYQNQEALPFDELKFVRIELVESGSN